MQPFFYGAAGLASGIAIAIILSQYLLYRHYVPLSRFREVVEENNQLKLSAADTLSKRELSDKFVPKDLYELLQSQLSEFRISLEKEKLTNRENLSALLRLTAEAEQKIHKSEIDKSFISREYFTLTQNKLEDTESELSRKQEIILSLNLQLAELTQKEAFLREKWQTFQREWENLQSLSRQEFRILATEIMEEKRKALTDVSKAELGNILDPFRAGMKEFREKVEATRKEDIAEMTSLKNEIGNLEKLSYQLSDDAKNLASALKSEVKMQGNWGEDRLNTILEVEGLQKYIDYSREESFRDSNDDQTRRPDFIIRLPDGKHVVIDSKVSLTAYTNYFNASLEEDRHEFLKQHLRSVSDHIEKLADKNYQSLLGLNTPDYVFMFMPVESALTLALNQDPEIFTQAIKRKIVLITPTTLVATLKVIKVLWQKENQVKNVEEIFRQCGELYDKFVTFLEQMEAVEAGLEAAMEAHRNAMYSLSEGTRKGHTIIGRFEAIRKLEAKADKRIKDKYLKEIGFLDDGNEQISGDNSAGME